MSSMPSYQAKRGGLPWSWLASSESSVAFADVGDVSFNAASQARFSASFGLRTGSYKYLLRWAEGSRVQTGHQQERDVLPQHRPYAVLRVRGRVEAPGLRRAVWVVAAHVPRHACLVKPLALAIVLGVVECIVLYDRFDGVGSDVGVVFVFLFERTASSDR